MDIGIDLGTTFSVIAVYGAVKVQGNYPAEQYLQECNVSLIPSPLGEFPIPSAFWQDPQDPNRVIVGSEAKELAKEGETPVLFSKRCIGTTQKLTIGKKEYTAREVATHILRYLKDCAEQALGVPVRRAVITHPAYFTTNQVEETRAAAAAAGFDMSLKEQLLMEPVAAAYSYVSGDSRETLRVLAYDLGGGTFDVTVLERKDGLISMRAFDGNPLLGGYNFDQRLATWIIQRARKSLEGTGRQLRLDENDPTDQSRWAQLLQLAERVKYDLVNCPTSKVRAPVKASEILRDTAGKPIQFLDRISREEYAALIQDLLEDTIDRAKNALEKARLKPQDLDEVLLVGGSSYGPWVREMVEKAFPGIKVALYNPDLCVAAGAAIYAHNDLPPERAVDSAAEFEITVDVRSTSPENIIHIPGTVRKTNGAPIKEAERALLSVELEMVKRADAGPVRRLLSALRSDGPATERLGPVDINENGVFIFRDVELLENAPTEMAVTLIDRQGAERCVQKFSVEYTSSGTVPVQFQVLPKPIFLRTGSGLVTVAQEAASLPVKSNPIELVRIHDDPTLDLDIYQGTDRVSTIHVEGIPKDAGAGSNVLLIIEITRDNVMKGRVEVRRANGSVATEWPIEIPFPPLQIPSLPELEQTYRHLEAKRLNLIENEQDPKRRTILGNKGGKISQRIKNLFDQEFRNAQEIHQGIQELEALVSPARDEMRPPLSEFEAAVKECQEEIAKGESKQVQERLERLDKITQEGHDAYKTRNKRHWDATWRTLQSFKESLNPQDDDKPRKLPKTPRLKDYAYQSVVVECSALVAAKRKIVESAPDYATKYAPRFTKIEKAISAQDAAIKSVSDSLEPEEALSELQPILNEEKRKILKMTEEAVIEVVETKMKTG